jgi:hypothetical protein
MFDIWSNIFQNSGNYNIYCVIILQFLLMAIKKLELFEKELGLQVRVALESICASKG